MLHEVPWKYRCSMSSTDGCCGPESCFEAGSWALSQAKVLLDSVAIILNVDEDSVIY